MIQIEWRAAALKVYLQMVKLLQVRGHSKWRNPFCLIIEATVITISGMHNPGREVRLEKTDFSEASSTPGEAERSVTVQAPVLILHFWSGSCLWFLTVSPCLSFRSQYRKGLFHLFQYLCSKVSSPKLRVVTESVLSILLRYKTKY